MIMFQLFIFYVKHFNQKQEDMKRERKRKLKWASKLVRGRKGGERREPVRFSVLLTVLHYSVQCYPMSCYAILRHVMLCYAMLCYFMLCFTILS